MLKTPKEKGLETVQALCSQTAPYEIGESQDALFLTAMKENVLWHIEKNEFYKKLCLEAGISKENIESLKDIKELPYIFANFFKKYEVKSIEQEDVFLHLTSSGTTGQKSQMFFDEWTIKSAQRMVDWIFEYYNWVTPEQSCNYLLYTYEPEEGSKLGTAYTDNFLCKYAPINEVRYALRFFGEKGHKFDIFGVIENLKRFEKDGKPVRIFGFPSFLYFTVKQMKELGLPPIKLHEDSLVFLGGGWKGFQDKAISKEELYSLVTEMLGIPDHRLRDGFGSVEHCVPYIECENHQFHVPTWSRVVIRDAKTLEPLDYNETGYLNFVSPYITSVPANNVLMGDLATLHKADSCSCSNKTPYFKIVGRAGVSKSKSCAIAASELLGEFQ